MILKREFKPFRVHEKVLEKHGLPLVPTPVAPRILHSPRLSDHIGCEVDVLDWTPSYTSSHKDLKAIDALQEAKSNGISIVTAVVSKESSYKNALEFAALYDSDIQIVNVYPGVQNFGVEYTPFTNHPLTPGRINLYVPTNEFLDPNKIEKLWKMITGVEAPNKRFLQRYLGADAMDELAHLQQSVQYQKMMHNLQLREMDLESVLDVTNARTYTNENPYHLPTEVLRRYNLVSVPAGTAEYVRGNYDSIRGNTFFELLAGLFNNTQLLVTVPPEHPLARSDSNERSDATNLRTCFPIKEHKDMIKKGGNRVFYTVPDNTKIDSAYGIMIAGVKANEHPDMRTSPTGSASLAPFVGAGYDRDSRELRDTYRFEPKADNPWKREAVSRPLTLQPRDRVLITNTGYTRDATQNNLLNIYRDSLPYNMPNFRRAEPPVMKITPYSGRLAA